MQRLSRRLASIILSGTDGGYSGRGLICSFRQSKEKVDDLEVAQLLDVLHLRHAHLVHKKLGPPLRAPGLSTQHTMLTNLPVQSLR